MQESGWTAHRRRERGGDIADALHAHRRLVRAPLLFLARAPRQVATTAKRGHDRDMCESLSGIDVVENVAAEADSLAESFRDRLFDERGDSIAPLVTLDRRLDDDQIAFFVQRDKSEAVLLDELYRDRSP